MPLSKQDKIDLVDKYLEILKDSKNIIFLDYDNIPVNEIVELRKDILKENAMYKVVKKRVFIKTLEKGWYPVDNNDIMKWVIAVLISYDDEISPLKKISSYKKIWKKAKKPYKMDYIWWYFEKKWQDSEYVNVFASIPTKEELISKLIYMMNYPLQWFVSVNNNILGSFVRVLDQISKKK